MHEISVAQSLVELIADEARKEGFRRVRRVHVRLGALGPVEPAALLFCFDVVAKGTPAEGARLELETVPGTGWCEACGCSVAIEQHYALCPACGRSHVRMTADAELRLTGLEVD